MQDIKRGDIFYIAKAGDCYGSEQSSNRPAIVISNDKCNEHSNVVEVVYLTTQRKAPLPTHVLIKSARLPSIALCEQIHSVDVRRLCNRISTCTKKEMDQIDHAIAISVGIASQNEQQLEEMLHRTIGERDAYKQMYHEMMERMMRN